MEVLFTARAVMIRFLTLGLVSIVPGKGYFEKYAVGKDQPAVVPRRAFPGADCCPAGIAGCFDSYSGFL